MTTPDLRYSETPCYPMLETSTPWADRWDRIYWRSSPLPTIEEMYLDEAHGDEPGVIAARRST